VIMPSAAPVSLNESVAGGSTSTKKPVFGKR
jgi:hypothetical protein